MRKSFLLVVLILVSLYSAVALGGGEAAIPPDLDTYDGLTSALESGEKILLFDVRTPEEYANGFIPGAENIPYDVITKRIPFWKKNRVIVVYCQSGGRSSRAFQALVDKGFKHVFDFGGVGNWKGDLETAASG